MFISLAFAVALCAAVTAIMIAFLPEWTVFVTLPLCFAIGWFSTPFVQWLGLVK